jgi:hypothetical protein
MTTCHALGCLAAIPDSMLMCRRHWYMVPKPLRDAIWQSYRSGDRDAHLRNCAEAVRVIVAKEQESAA